MIFDYVNRQPFSSVAIEYLHEIFLYLFLFFLGVEHSADANPKLGRGSTADRTHTSRLSLSTNCSVTAPVTGADKIKKLTILF